MSSCTTHMLIGGVAGLALARVVGTGSVPGIPPLLVEGAIVAGSALLATVPDIDEPGSWIGRRVHAAVAFAGAPIGALVGYALAPRLGMQPLTVALIGALIGIGLVGPLMGFLVLRIIRRAAGGHRRLTHSLVLAAVLAGLAFVFWRVGQGTWALVPAALAWSIVIHDIGDIVTPAGVPLIWPLSTHDVRVLPRPLCQFGEPIVAVVTLAIGFLLVRA